MKKIKNLVAALIAMIMAIACMGVIAACGDDSDDAKTLDSVTNFTYDITTGEYSFTGVDNASYYKLDVYATGSTVALASTRITATSDTSYSGTFSVSVSAGDYDVTCTAMASGYTSSTVTISVTAETDIVAEDDSSSDSSGGGTTEESTGNYVDITGISIDELYIYIHWSLGSDTTVTGTLTAVDETTDGSSYSYTVAATGGSGESVTGTVELLTDGTAMIVVDAFGPFSTTTVTGSWSESDGSITVTL